MTKITKNIVKCAVCGTESEQMIVHSVNYLIGSKEDNDALMNSKQKCSNCGYENNDISKIDGNLEKVSELLKLTKEETIRNSKKIDEINNIIKENKEAKNISTKEISDGHHTFGELYHHRIILFCTICNLFPNISWKSKKHFDEENDPMFPDSFIAGINTPDGIATYHIKLQYWDLFNIPEIDRAPKFDFYSSDESLKRILSLTRTKK